MSTLGRTICSGADDRRWLLSKVSAARHLCYLLCYRLPIHHSRPHYSPDDSCVAERNYQEIDFDKKGHEVDVDVGDFAVKVHEGVGCRPAHLGDRVLPSVRTCAGKHVSGRELRHIRDGLCLTPTLNPPTLILSSLLCCAQGWRARQKTRCRKPAFSTKLPGALGRSAPREPPSRAAHPSKNTP